MGRVHQAADEDALAELADASANFGFLLPLEPLLLLYGAGAEADAHAHPDRSLAQARQFAEVLTAEFARLLGPESADGAADGPVHRALTELHRSGNPSPGGETRPDDRSRARHLVRHCFDLGVWYFRLRTGVRDALTFVPPAEWDDTPAGSPHRKVTAWEPVTGLATWVALLDEYVPALRRAFDRRTPAETGTRESLKARAAILEAEWRVADLLTEAGWTVQDGSDALYKLRVRGVAVRGTAQPDGAAGPDYVLRVDGRPVGTVEVQPRGGDLRAAMTRTRGTGIRSTASAEPRMHYTYATDGVRVLFRNGDDPEPGPREVFTFHQPDTLALWQREAAADPQAPTFQSRVRLRLPDLSDDGRRQDSLRSVQYDAVRAFESSLRRGERRAMVQIAVGGGRTVTAVTAAHRLLRHARARRILFLVDRVELEMQALATFAAYSGPGDDGRKFTELYRVERLGLDAVPSHGVVVSTVQRLISALSGGDPTSGVHYRPNLPPESFDLVIADDCHRSVSPRWRALFNYFDAPVLGLTATPTDRALEVFQDNLVSSYTFEDAVADDRAVGVTVYRVGGLPTRPEWTADTLEEEYGPDAEETPGHRRSVVSGKALHAALTAFKEGLRSMFPERAELGSGEVALPKTVVYAADDRHADEVVATVRTVFGQGPGFCRKVTLKSGSPYRLLAEFRNTIELRVVVVVGLVLAGTDTAPVECVLFLRDVKSANRYFQMVAVGTRPIASTELRAVTPGASAKTQCVVVDPFDATRHYADLSSATRKRRKNTYQDPAPATVDDYVEVMERWRSFLRAGNGPARDLITSTRILTEGDVRRLRSWAESLARPPHDLTAEQIWSAYERAGVTVPDPRRPRTPKGPVDLLGLVRYEAGLEPRPRPYRDQVFDRLGAWIDRQERQGRSFDPDQLWWMESIADCLATDGHFNSTSLANVPFTLRGGTSGFLRAFGEQGGVPLLDELSRGLA
ncbi:DEAD/DEAH box helicase family protein [Streptomyces sp. MMS21 TC-5]|uniref:type I restriction endonuclease subunit R n=1 Tax=Streptomyces sp. MMS21 TC-5 TaxID=2925833 RepID=UPI001F609E61|nr:type I restriction endonuclease subunit R [Streptomyces sp. MMS21 TC-5]MCI4085648.1 DEAD/DEAH box helicase family protein [Streptomyces sp. MMS21 TC-5]